ncbi:type II toxin-antitoxin system RelE/ParE family toxin [Mycetocola sp. JXN-3]|uniref:type II toxin-antitoxin system RelE/ParE family toxin n=1 Tax=Mycetocola sp. JXN-3 TaxID=2116510 RepID=UPI00165CF92B|nr:type II toxin-antitoxin system RelE/ParE family toxin [Mycetocola sp. JXN-3]
MRRRIITTLSADHDIDAAVDHYIDHEANDVALRFVDSLEATLERLAEHPSLGSAQFAEDAGISDLLSITLQRFPYTVFYTGESDALRVHRVLNTQRDIFDTLAHR